jgi:Ca-activated chloride channel family protein
MRSILFYISAFIALTLQAQSVSNSMQDFGKVKMWNNPVFEVNYTNISGRTQLFLPIRYQRDFKVSFEKNKLAPGESTSINIQYFTEDFGRFNKTVNVFISTQDAPLVFSLKGNIQSFHPDAFTICPRIDNSNLQVNNGFLHTIKVVDEATKEPLGDFELTIITNTSKEQLINEKSFIILKREKPDFYQMQIDKEGYEVARFEKFVQRNSKETVIELRREVLETMDEEYHDFTGNKAEKEDDIISEEVEEIVVTILEPAIDEDAIEEESEPISDDDEYFDFSKVNDEEEPVQEDSADEIVVVNDPEPKDTSDFKLDGTLNESIYTYNHLVFLIDVSASMNKPGNLPLLKKSMLEMIEVLRPQDLVSIITYSNKAVVLLSNVSGAEKNVLNLSINQLEAKGGSNGQEGVNMAYNLAKQHFIADGNNEVILASDGIFNSKKFSEKKIFRQARIQRSIYKVRISTVGFGTATKPLLFLENLARSGEGSFIKIGTENEAKTSLS